MLRSDWFSYNWAICYSPLVAKAPAFWREEKDYSLALTSLSCFVSIFTKTIIPLALMASESMTQSPFGLEE